jgi:hypothetical protein
MTDEERLSRGEALKRAAALAGAVYVAPVLTSSSRAEPQRRRCRPGKTCRAWGDCRDRSGPCICCPEGTAKASTCQKSWEDCDGPCAPDSRCPPTSPCGVLIRCESPAWCACFILVRGQWSDTECIDFPSPFCADYPPCNRDDGSGCPPGSCCLDTCCPEGICGVPCRAGLQPRTSAGSGPTLTTDFE